MRRYAIELRSPGRAKKSTRYSLAAARSSHVLCKERYET